MLYNLLSPHAADWWFGFNLFKYITFRTGGAMMTALLISLVFGNRFISFLRKKQKGGQPIRDDGPLSHIVTKQGTPTMGGFMILGSLTLSTLLWSDLTSAHMWLTLFVTVGCGLIGFLDDYLKVHRKNSKGVSSKLKFLMQLVIAGMAISVLYSNVFLGFEPTLKFPFVKNIALDLGLFFIPFGLLVIVGASNAVNLTDGLDGLAIGPMIIAGMCFAVFSYVAGHAVFSTYLQVPHIPGTGEITVFCGALVGAGLGFLWFNAPPAMVFMGDTGSLALGGALGIISIMIKQELTLLIVGGLFAVEAISVIIQVGYFKATGGKRIFLMAPLHHHFEKKGWSEPTIVIRFWIISIILAVIGLASLKIR